MNCKLNAHPGRGCLFKCAIFFRWECRDGTFITHLSGVQYSLCSNCFIEKNNRFLIVGVRFLIVIWLVSSGWLRRFLPAYWFSREHRDVFIRTRPQNVLHREIVHQEDGIWARLFVWLMCFLFIAWQVKVQHKLLYMFCTWLVFPSVISYRISDWS